MYSESRQSERRSDIIEMLKNEYRVQDVIDYSGLEKDGVYLEGTGAMVLDTFYGFFTPGTTERKVVGGIPDLVIDGLDRHGMLIKRPNTYGAGAGYTYDPEVLKVVWDGLVADAGVRLFLHTHFIDLAMDGETVAAVIVGSPKGPRAIRAKCVVDAEVGQLHSHVSLQESMIMLLQARTARRAP